MATHIRGTRSLVAAAAVAATALVGIVSAPTPAQSVIAGDCTTPFPVSDLVADQAVTGLTVSRGTTPDAFDGVVLGVLKDYVAPGLDMVMVRLTSPEIDRVGGVWSGMSGSPVYAEDGRLIGAVAWGLGFGPSPVAGVTPFEDMNDYLPSPPPATLRLPAKAAQKIAAETDVTAAQASQGFAQLRMPLTVAGAGRGLDAGKKRTYTARATASGGTASASAAGPDSIVAGGNLAFTGSTGDITLGGVGTATSVCDDTVVGFGHPATFRGKISAGMNPADALYIQDDPVFGPFKVANIGATAGTITDDHLTGITGTFGAAPPSFDVTSTVNYGARTRTGSSQVLMSDYAADVTFYELLGNHDRVLDGRIPGTEENTWTISGHKPNGDPFTITLGDRYTDDDVVLYSSIWDIPDMVWVLSRMPGVTLDGVTMSGDVVDDTTTWSVTSAEYRKGSRWVKVANRRDVVFAKAGKTLKMRVLVTDAQGNTRKVPVALSVPGKAKGSQGMISVAGGTRYYDSWWSARNVEQMLKTANAHVRNDQVVAQMEAYARRSAVSKRSTSTAQDHVVQGRKRFTIVVN